MLKLSHLFTFTCSGADITATDTEAFTPLMIAAGAGHADAFNVLLKRGAAIDDTDENGKTVVHIAAEANHVAILRVSYCSIHIHWCNRWLSDVSEKP